MAKAAKSLMEKFNKAKEGDKRAKKGLSRRLSSARKEVERLKRAEAKDRQAAVKDTMSRLGEILGERTNMARIQENAHVMEQGMEQMGEIFQRDNLTAMTILDIQKFALLIEAAVANCEADNLHDAVNAQDEFNIAVNELVISTLEAEEELDEEKIAALWDTCVSERDNRVLMRGTTAFFSVNMHIQQVTGLVRNGECEDWQAEITRRLSSLFAKYDIDVTVGDLADIFAVI